jgi:hypothetical protein
VIEKVIELYQGDRVAPVAVAVVDHDAHDDNDAVAAMAGHDDHDDNDAVASAAASDSNSDLIQ